MFLPFSLSSAPFIFIKVMRCLVQILEEGRDTFNKGCSLDLALEEAEFITNSYTQCGFIIDSEKSIRQSQKELI